MADVFNESTIPIVFNAFAISSGRELLFCNPAAFDFLDVTAGYSVIVTSCTAATRIRSQRHGVAARRGHERARPLAPGRRRGGPGTPSPNRIDAPGSDR